MKCVNDEKVYIFYEQGNDNSYRGLVAIVLQIVFSLCIFAVAVAFDSLEISSMDIILSSFKHSLLVLKAAIIS